MGGRAAGAIKDVPWDPAVLIDPHPPNLVHRSADVRPAPIGHVGAAASLPPDVVHINFVDATLLGKGWMYHVNNKLHSVHPSLRAIRFRFPLDDVHDLC